MEREDVLPSAPPKLTSSDRKLFNFHFQNRFKVENSIYGNLQPSDVFPNENNFTISPNQLNSDFVSDKIKRFAPDFCFIFGADLIKEPVMSTLPKQKINLHLGLSPWYKGAATLFWPFYYLQPQFCGVTFHQISDNADAGAIVHQTTPKLKRGQKIHDVAAECVISAKNDLPLLIKKWIGNGQFIEKKQLTTGRNWRSSDFHASHLKVIYQLYNDDIVDHYLDGSFSQVKPILHNGLN